MEAYVFQADFLCGDCGVKIKKVLPPPDSYIHNDESSYDSADWPKGPYGDGGGEADCPQHCGECGLFLENPLTDQGEEYVKEEAENLRIHVEKEGLAQAWPLKAVNDWKRYYSYLFE